MAEPGMATLVEIRDYFGFKGMTALKEEWGALSDEEKTWFKVELHKVLNP